MLPCVACTRRNIFPCAPRERVLRSWLKDAFFCCLFFAAVALLVVRGAMGSGYHWQWERALPFFFTPAPESLLGFHLGPLLANGLVTTLRISVCSLVLALATGLVLAVLRLAGGPVSRNFALGAVQTVRNMPLMVLLLGVYMFVPAGWNLSAEAIAILVLGLFEGAYMAEIFRAGILGVPTGQWEAAKCLGLSPWQAWRMVALPQAARQSLPPIVSQSVSLVKDSSLASIIAVSELSQQSGIIASDTFLPFEIWLPVAGIYLLLALCLAGLAKRLEVSLSKGHTARTAKARAI